MSDGGTNVALGGLLKGLQGWVPFQGDLAQHGRIWSSRDVDFFSHTKNTKALLACVRFLYSFLSFLCFDFF